MAKIIEFFQIAKRIENFLAITQMGRKLYQNEPKIGKIPK